MFIPRTLDEVAAPEADIALLRAGGVEHSAVTGLNVIQGGKQTASSSEAEQEEEEEGEEEERRGFVFSRRPRQEDSQAKAARKKAVKDAKADKRKEKIPKHVKKRKEKSSK